MVRTLLRLFNIHIFSSILTRGGVTAYRNHLPLRGHEGRAVADTQLGLQGVEVNFQLALLLHLRRLVLASVVPEVFQLPLHLRHGLLWSPVLQPGSGAADPLQQLGNTTTTWEMSGEC